MKVPPTLDFAVAAQPQLSWLELAYLGVARLGSSRFGQTSLAFTYAPTHTSGQCH